MAAGGNEAGLEAPVGSLGAARSLFLILIALAAFLPGLSLLPPFDRDEPRYTQASKQMVETADYFDIRFQEEPRHKKPIGIYWLQAGTAKLSGLGADAPLWVYRLVSLFGAVAAVLGTGLLGARFFGREAGFLAGAGLALCLLMGVEARLAKTDAVLLACIVAMQAGLGGTYLKSRAGQGGGSWGLAALFWGGLAVGVLIKGPVTPVVAGLTGLFLCIADRRWRWLFALKPLPGILLSAAVVLPWFLAITLESGGGFLKQSFGQDILAKVFEGQESHGALPGYYLALFWATSWPFGPVLLLGFLVSWRNRSDPAVRFLLAWIVPTWVLFELIMTKLPHYVLPTYPALFLLMGWSVVAGIDALPKQRQIALLRLGQGLFLLVCIGLFVFSAVLAGSGGADWYWTRAVRGRCWPPPLSSMSAFTKAFCPARSGSGFPPALLRPTGPPRSVRTACWWPAASPNRAWFS